MLETLDLPKLTQALTDFSPVLISIGKVVSKYEQLNFDSQGSVFNSPWHPLSPNTIKQKERLGFTQDLVRTGKLRDSLQDLMFTPTSVSIPNKIDYANYINLGTSKMPARILVGVSRDEVEEIKQLIQEYLTEHGWTPGSFTITSSLQKNNIQVSL